MGPYDKEETDVSMQLMGTSSNSRGSGISGRVSNLSNIAKKTKAIIHLTALPETPPAFSSLTHKLTEDGATRATDTIHAAAEKPSGYQNSHEQTAAASPSSSVSEACVSPQWEITEQPEWVNINGFVYLESAEGGRKMPVVPRKSAEERLERADIPAENIQDPWTPAKTMTDTVQEKQDTDVSMQQSGSNSSINDEMSDKEGGSFNDVDDSSNLLCDREAENRKSQQDPVSHTTEDSATDLSPYTEKLGKAVAAYAGEIGSSHKGSSSISTGRRISGGIRKLGETAESTRANRHLAAHPVKLSLLAYLKDVFTRYGADLESAEGGPNMSDMPKRSAEERLELADIAAENIHDPSTPAETMTDTVQEKQKTDVSMQQSGSSSSIIEEMSGKEGGSINDVDVSSTLLCDGEAGNRKSQQDPASHTVEDPMTDLSLYTENLEKAEAAYAGEIGSSDKGSSSNSTRRRSGDIRKLCGTAKGTHAILHLPVLPQKLSAVAALKMMLTKPGAAGAIDTSSAVTEETNNYQQTSDAPLSSLSEASVTAEPVDAGEEEGANINGCSDDLESAEGGPNMAEMPKNSGEERLERADLAAEIIQEPSTPAERMTDTVKEPPKNDLSMHQSGSSSRISDELTDNRGEGFNDVDGSSNLFCDGEAGTRKSHQDPASRTMVDSMTDLSLYTENLEKAEAAYAGEMGSSDKGSSSNSTRRRISGAIRKLGGIARKACDILHLNALLGKLSAVAALKMKLPKRGTARAVDTSYAVAEETSNYEKSQEQTADAPLSSSASGACVAAETVIAGEQEAVNSNGFVDVESVEGRVNMSDMSTRIAEEIYELPEVTLESAEELENLAEIVTESVSGRADTA